MQRILFTLIIIFVYNSISISQSDFKQITFSEFLDSIENEPTLRVKFENVLIIDYSESEKDSIVIDKNLVFENVYANFYQTFDKIVFNKSVDIINSGFFVFKNCKFNGIVKIDVNEKNNYKELRDNINVPFKFPLFFDFENCEFNKMLDLDFDAGSFEGGSFLNISNTFFKSKANNTWNLENLKEFNFTECNLNFTDKDFNINLENIDVIEIEKNSFQMLKSKFKILEHENLLISNNTFQCPLFLEIPNINKHDFINWENIEGNTYNELNFSPLLNSQDLSMLFSEKRDSMNKVLLDSFTNHLIIENQDFFIRETAFLGKFRNHYRDGHNRDWANMVYTNMKDLETKRLKFLNSKQSSFENYFQLKINQFLKLFSEYGTNPAKSIVISVYVIFIFALFYLLFPNSWDENNRHRVMNRMLFFTKYFKRKEGMKEVFEEERKSKIMAYEDFKDFINNSKNEIPPYFITLSKPIYAISTANFKIQSKILNRADILKGKWAELSPRRKAFTSIIMAIWLVAILLYDLFVKFFNALMLSINTFSTLGFGEIPIKGIPRYLAILQGFLGWFMLSIFSVSLISQMLN